jgi:hypothetical protein
VLASLPKIAELVAGKPSIKVTPSPTPMIPQ